MLKDQHFINLITTGITTGYNHPKTNIKGISSCYECKSNNIEYDEIHDQIECKNCGLILRQGITDYTPITCATFQMTSREHKNKKDND